MAKKDPGSEQVPHSLSEVQDTDETRALRLCSSPWPPEKRLMFAYFFPF
jgi:hypothetical protein